MFGRSATTNEGSSPTVMALASGRDRHGQLGAADVGLHQDGLAGQGGNWLDGRGGAVTCHPQEEAPRLAVQTQT